VKPLAAGKSDSASPVPATYPALLAEIKTRIRAARLRASLAANHEMLRLYWDIGRMILTRQSREGWGARVVDRLSADLRRAFPEHRGFSPRNLKYMRAFAEAWPEISIVQRPVAQLAAAGGGMVHQPRAQLSAGKKSESAIVQAPLAQTTAAVSAIVQRTVAQLPWRHHVALLDKLDAPADRLWYAAKAVEHGWSRDVLAHHIGSGLHQRQGRAVTNFARTLPAPQSDLAQQITKDPYLFDFLTLHNDANERAVELTLLAHVEQFLLELGAGFALVGRQVHLEIGGQDFYLDLLFYHLHLRCFIVVDLKVREFTPEAAGKMNFYLSAVDDRFRQPGDQPSLGLILCQSKNRVIAEYALRDIKKPVGVADYVTRLVATLPAPLKNAVPSIAAIERGLKNLPK
jgi:predicted nuclease of restriction endonuclease-like (RecB) superfamily